MVFLGHVIFRNGIFVDPREVKAIVNWECSKNATEIRSFLSLVRYYKRFMEHFFTNCRTFNSVNSKRVKFEWNDKCEKNFQKLKNRLIFAPILTFPTSGAGYVLMLRDKVLFVF